MRYSVQTGTYVKLVAFYNGQNLNVQTQLQALNELETTFNIPIALTKFAVL